MEHVRIYSMFDADRDADLHQRLLEQGAASAAEFTVCAESPAASTEAREERVRRSIRAADEVVVLCGEHTEASEVVAADFRIVLEEHKPYMLLWGRRERMCTKPEGAKPADAMYSWTFQILNLQIRETLRHARFRSAGEDEAKRQARKASAMPAREPI